MMNIIEVLQYCIIPIYFISGVFSIQNMFISCKMWSFHVMMNGAILISSVSYIVLQLDWISGDYSEEIGTPTDFAWLLHEYLVGLIIMTLTMIAPGFIKLDNKK